MFWILITIVLTLVAMVFVDRWQKHEGFEKLPGPKGVLFLENALDFLMDHVKLFYYVLWLTSSHKRLFKVKIGPKKFVVLYEPHDVEAVISGPRNTRKGYLYSFIQPWLRDGLLLSNGLKWHQRRKILTYAFHFKILRQFNSVIAENSKSLVEQLNREVDNETTNLVPYIHDFSLNSICETAMGTKLDSEATDTGRRYKKGIFDLGQLLVDRAQRFWLYPSLLYSISTGGRKQNKILALFKVFRDSVIHKRRETNNFQNLILDAENCDDDEEDGLMPGKKRLAMLDLLLQAEKDGDIDADGIGEEVDTFIFEGHDTTATSLQFTFMLLANNQHWQDKIVEECEQIFGSSTRAATMNDLSQMKYLECCLKESLRLYPPVPFVMRKIDQDIKLKNCMIPAGTDCTVLIMAMQRRYDQFVDPLEFHPERFLVEPTWHPYAYIPFSAGPRNCIGQRFAMMEMKLAVSAVLRRYRLLPVTKPQDLVFVTHFLLRLRDPIYIKLEKRNCENVVAK